MTKIEPIFDNETLFAVNYKEGGLNELVRLIEFWNNVDALKKHLNMYCSELVKEHGLKKLLEWINEELEEINTVLTELEDDPAADLSDFFIALNKEDTEFRLAKKKVKFKRENGLSLLRIYAIKIDENCYLVTGGVIKTTFRMGKDIEAKQQIAKIDIWRSTLNKAKIKGRQDFLDYLKKYYGK